MASYLYLSQERVSKNGKRGTNKSWLVLAGLGHPSAGMGYIFYVILRIISYIKGDDKTRDRKYGRIFLPIVLSFVVFIMATLIIIFSR